VLAVAKGSGLQPTPEGLAGKIIGVQVSTVHEAYAKKHFTRLWARSRSTRRRTRRTPTSPPAASTRHRPIRSRSTPSLQSEQGKACCELTAPVAEDLEVLGPGVGIGVRKDDTELRDKFNAAIKAIRDNGKYDEISKKYFNFDMYGG
jgi:polar amino acid transport system substrate-binding protein